MKRLCIYVTYNKENKIYEYIGKELKELKENCTRICLVCNYKKIIEGLEYAATYIDDLYNRGNRGYDSGAYKDILCDLLGWNEVRQYDELILVNDSFFGFFYPLQNTFDLMEKRECDFWGITGQGAGELSNPVYSFDAHIHSYFFVFRKNVISSREFQDFWDNYSYPQNFWEAIVGYEYGLNHYLKQHGFKGTSYIDIYNVSLETNENPYYSRPHELIREYKVPVLKKKCVLIRNPGFKSTLDTIAYLKKERLYPVDWILPYLENQFYIRGFGKEPCNSLELFYNTYPHIYIYGFGVCGKNLSAYFSYKGWEYQGFIVTDSTDTEEAISIEKAEIHADTGIIISVLDKTAAEEIERHIGNRCRREQLFFVSHCDAIKFPD